MRAFALLVACLLVAGIAGGQDNPKASELRKKISEHEKEIRKLQAELDKLDPNGIPAEKRKELIDALIVANKLTEGNYKAQIAEAEEKAEQVKAGRINTAITKTQEPKGKTGYVFKSVADKNAAIEKAKEEVQAAKSFPDRVLAKSLFPALPLKKAEVGDFGWVGPNFLVKVEEVKNAERGTFGFYSSYAGSSGGFGGVQTTQPRIVQPKHLYSCVITGIDTKKMTTDSWAKLDGMFYVKGTIKVGPDTFRHMVPVALTDDEIKSMDPRKK